MTSPPTSPPTTSTRSSHVIETRALDPDARRAAEQRIAATRRHRSPGSSGGHDGRRGARAAAAEAGQPVYPEIELGREYMLAVGQPPPDSGYADQYMAHLQHEGLTPMLRQPRGERDFEVVEPRCRHLRLAPGLGQRDPSRSSRRRPLTRPVDGPLALLLSTRSMPGVATIDAVGPGGPVARRSTSARSSPCRWATGRRGARPGLAHGRGRHDSIEGFLGIRSFVVLRADDLRAQVVAHKAPPQALRQELDFMTGTRSWKVTAPLRRFKGRGSGGR